MRKIKNIITKEFKLINIKRETIQFPYGLKINKKIPTNKYKYYFEIYFKDNKKWNKYLNMSILANNKKDL